jgi:hypothetical protein
MNYEFEGEATPSNATNPIYNVLFGSSEISAELTTPMNAAIRFSL